VSEELSVLPWSLPAVLMWRGFSLPSTFITERGRQDVCYDQRVTLGDYTLQLRAWSWHEPREAYAFIAVIEGDADYPALHGCFDWALNGTEADLLAALDACVLQISEQLGKLNAIGMQLIRAAGPTEQTLVTLQTLEMLKSDPEYTP
jgi:hypothetical protein